MPIKIFSDLISFVGDHTGQLKEKFDAMHRLNLTAGTEKEMNRSTDLVSF